LTWKIYPDPVLLPLDCIQVTPHPTSPDYHTFTLLHGWTGHYDGRFAVVPLCPCFPRLGCSQLNTGSPLPHCNIYTGALPAPHTTVTPSFGTHTRPLEQLGCGLRLYSYTQTLHLFGLVFVTCLDTFIYFAFDTPFVHACSLPHTVGTHPTHTQQVQHSEQLDL